MVTRKRYAGKGTIPKTIKGPKELYDYLWSVTKDIEFDEDPVLNDEMRHKVHRFIAHVYNSMKSKLTKKDIENSKDDGHQFDLFVPIYSRLIEKVFGRDFKVLSLRDYGLVNLIRAENLQHKSRYFSLPRKIWKDAWEIEDKSISDAWLALTAGEHSKFVPFNLMTGERIRTVNKNIFDPVGQSFKTPDLIKNSMKAISPCVFDPKYVGWLVDGVEKKYHKKEEEAQRLIDNGKMSEEESVKLEKDMFSLEKKFINERSSQRAILYQQPKLIETTSDKGDLLYAYNVAHKPQVSGRLTEIGGGLQNASRVFKYLAFKSNKAVFNYDLKSSQANILKQELKKCNIDGSWISEYMDDPEAKKTFSAIVGVDTETWKKCLYSTFMGANPGLPGSAIQRALIAYFNDEDKAKKALSKYKDVARDLLSACIKWRDYIISPDSHYLYDSRRGGYRHWKNASGMKHKRYGLDRNDNIVLMESVEDHKKEPEKYEIKILKKTSVLKRKLAAFILQGQEACFIHQLTLLCKAHKIKVMKNEHDGIITNKPIPIELVTEASKLAGLEGAQLEDKALASEDDIIKASRLIRKKIQ